MRVSGFSFVRNGTSLGYPYIASIKSLLLLCDEVIVAVGASADDTLAQIRAINDQRLRVIETSWNENMTDRGYVYAQQKMIAQFNCSGDWAFYLECDEIIHEQDVAQIKQQMAQHLVNPAVEALVFDYYHFYGAPDFIASSPRWYRRAPRIIRNNIRAWAPDGLFWLVMQQNKRGRYPQAALVNCPIYHYGHVRKVSYMQEKNQQVEKYWGKTPGRFNTYANIDARTIRSFHGTHPRLIQEWLTTHAEANFLPNPNYQLTTRDKRHRVLQVLSGILGNYDFSKKHYKLIAQ